MASVAGPDGRRPILSLAVQALVSTVIRRPFHWGIVIVADEESGGQIPDVDPANLVSSNEHGIVATIRHAQDVDSFAGEFDWAEAQVVVRLLPHEERPATTRREVFRGAILVPSGRISIGDADSDVIHPAHRGWNQLVVTVGADVEVTELSPDEVRIDLFPSA
jgi:hypothetical protein